MAVLIKNAFVDGTVVETLVAAAAAGDSVPSFTFKDEIVIRNAHATLPRTITFVNQELSSHGTDVDKAIVIAALTTRKFNLQSIAGPVTRWKDPSTSSLSITYSDSAADLTIGVFTHP